MNFGSMLIRDTRSTQWNGARSEQSRRRRGSNGNGRIVILGLNGKPNVKIFASAVKVKLTGASSSAGCVGELECMKGATSIIDFFSMLEAGFDFVCMLKNQPYRRNINGTNNSLLTSALRKRATSDSNIPIFDCRVLIVLSRYKIRYQYWL
jgi:hypothetical protein